MYLCTEIKGDECQRERKGVEDKENKLSDSVREKRGRTAPAFAGGRGDLFSYDLIVLYSCDVQLDESHR